jgi:prefoldin alpha subunit
MNDEEELNKLAMRAQILNREAQTMQNQIDMMQTAVANLDATIDTLKNLKKAQKDTIVPIGSGAYITCNEVDTQNVLVAVGAGFIVKKTASEAVDIFETKRKDATESLEKAQKAFLQLSQNLQDLNARATMISARMEENVRATQE